MGAIRDRIRQFAKKNYEKPHLRSLADASHINYQQLSQYDDDNLPSGPVMIKLQRVGLSIDWLLSGYGPMAAPHPEFDLMHGPTSNSIITDLHRLTEVIEGYIQQKEHHHPEGIEEGGEEEEETEFGAGFSRSTVG